MTTFLLIVMVLIAAGILASTDRGLYLLRCVFTGLRCLLLWLLGGAVLGGVCSFAIAIGGWVAFFVPAALAALVARTLFGLR